MRFAGTPPYSPFAWQRPSTTDPAARIHPFSTTAPGNNVTRVAIQTPSPIEIDLSSASPARRSKWLLSWLIVTNMVSQPIAQSSPIETLALPKNRTLRLIKQSRPIHISLQSSSRPALMWEESEMCIRLLRRYKAIRRVSGVKRAATMSFHHPSTIASIVEAVFLRIYLRKALSCLRG